MIYILYWLFFTFLAIIEVNTSDKNKSLKNLLLFVSVFSLVLLIGLRWETGTDWLPYEYFFNSLNGVPFFGKINEYELGYSIFNQLIRLISNNYSILLFIHSIIFFSFLSISFKKISPFPALALFLYMCFFFGMTGANRQLLALAICMLGLKKIIDGKPFYFFLCVAIAFTIHTTALLFVLYFFIRKKINNYFLLISVLLAIIVGFTEIPKNLFMLSSILSSEASNKVSVYLEIAKFSQEYSIIGILRRIVFTIIFVFTSTIIGKFDKRYFVCLNGYIISIVFFFLFHSVPVMAGRAILYFNVMEPILLVYFLYLFPSPVTKNIFLIFLCLLGIALFLQSINAYPDLFIPYKGIFINENFYRRLY